jgi:SEL1 protein
MWLNRGAAMHLERGELKFASTYFENAIRQGSPFEAYYYTAAIQAAQARNRNIPDFMTNGFCAIAVSFYKLVAERGVWDDDLLRDAEISWLSGTDRGQEMAMLKWWIAAERGFEVAQNNMAYILDQG